MISRGASVLLRRDFCRADSFIDVMSVEPGFLTDVTSVQRRAPPVGRFAWLVGLAATVLMGLGLVGSPAAGHAAGGDRLVPRARLTPSGGPIDNGSIAMSSGVLVAGASGLRPGMNTQGAAYVFTRPAGGWSDESDAAKLIASDGRVGDGFGSSVAIAGATVVVGSGAFPGNGPYVLYVFTKPSGGWSGTLHERARLIVGGRAVGPLGPVAISGNTIAVGDFQSGPERSTSSTSPPEAGPARPTRAPR